MSDVDDFADALAAAQLRPEGRGGIDPTPVSEADAVAMIRGLAHLCGHDPDAVAESFLQGGPLADLARAVLGAAVPPKKTRGRPRKLVSSWHAFSRVVQHMRAGHTQEDAIGIVAEQLGASITGVRSAFTRTRDRDGVSVEAVPESRIGALYADPRAHAAPQKIQRLQAPTKNAKR